MIEKNDGLIAAQRLSTCVIFSRIYQLSIAAMTEFDQVGALADRADELYRTFFKEERCSTEKIKLGLKRQESLI